VSANILQTIHGPLRNLLVSYLDYLFSIMLGISKGLNVVCGMSEHQPGS